jgi:sensory rhodopsin
MAQTGVDPLVYWIGAAVLALGTIYLVTQGRKLADGREPYYLAAGAVPLVSAIGYVLLALGIGEVTAANDTVVSLVRYAEWALTLGLIGYALWVMAEATPGLLGAMLGLILVAMAAAGAAAILPGGPAVALGVGQRTLALAGVSIVALFASLGVLFRPISRHAGQLSAEPARLFSMLRNFAAIPFLGFAFVWLLGPAVVGLAGPVAQAGAFLVVDVVGKLGFATLVFRTYGKLSQARSASPV